MAGVFFFAMAAGIASFILHFQPCFICMHSYKIKAQKQKKKPKEGIL